MTTNEPIKTFSERATELNLKAGGKRTVKTDLNYSKHGDVVPAGTVLDVYFSPVNHSQVFFRYGSDRVKAISLTKAHKYLAGFSKPPGLNTLEKYSSNGVCKTPTGHKTEPDGFGQDNSPSWLLVIGVI